MQAGKFIPPAEHTVNVSTDSGREVHALTADTAAQPGGNSHLGGANTTEVVAGYLGRVIRLVNPGLSTDS